MERTIYIAGPITGMKDLNRPLFKEAADIIRKTGLLVRNPHEFCEDLPSTSKWAEYMRRCLPELMKCTDIIMLPGWKHSEGANLEYYNARAIGIRIHYSLDGFMLHLCKEVDLIKEP